MSSQLETSATKTATGLSSAVATPDYTAIKLRQQATWASGDFAVVGTTLPTVRADDQSNRCANSTRMDRVGLFFNTFNRGNQMNSIAKLKSDQRVGQAHKLSRISVKSTAASIRSIGIGVLIVTAAASALAVGKTLSITEEIDLAAPPSQIWATIKDFDNWQAWHPAFASTKIIKGQGNARGVVRVLTAKDGAKFTEVLESHNDATRTYSYRINESPLPIAGYVSTLEVKPNKGGSSVVWSSNFTVDSSASEDDVKKAITGVYRAGLDNLGSVVK